MSRRTNRTVRPFRGDLFKIVEKNFAWIPLKDSMGRKVKEEDGLFKKIRKREVCDSFEIYYNLCLIDEYFRMLYELNLQGTVSTSNLQRDFSKSWRYILRNYASKAPKGVHKFATKIEDALKEVDASINLGLRGIKSGTDINTVMGVLKSASSSTAYKKTVTYYANYLKLIFKTFGFNVVTTEKSNPRFNVRYVQFELGGDKEDLIANSSAMVASKIEDAKRLKKLRDAKLKGSLLEQGFHVETQPVFLKEGKRAYLTVAYDPVVTRFTKPTKPKKQEFSDKEYDLVVNLENLVRKHTIYPDGIDPIRFFKETKSSVVKKDSIGDFVEYEIQGDTDENEEIIGQIKSTLQLATKYAVPKYQAGFGVLPNGKPEAGYQDKGVFKGSPIYRYVIPKTKSKVYAQAVQVLKRLLTLRGYSEQVKRFYEDRDEYKADIKPYVKGVYHSSFTDDLGTGYIQHTSMKTLAKKVVAQQEKEEIKRLLKPKIDTVPLELPNYPVWDNKENKIVYQTKTIQVARVRYPKGAEYNPVRYSEVLKEALEKIKLGVLKTSFREIKEGDGTLDSSITKTLQVATLKDHEGVKREVIVSGRYAGFTLESIMNMEGRFLEEGYFTKSANGETIKNRIEIDPEGNVSTVLRTKKGDKWINDQRLIEPYITLNPKTNTLILGIPGGSTNTADRRLMRHLSEKISSVKMEKDPRLPKAVMNLNPFFTFTAEDFEVIRDTLGSVALSASASKFMDKYYLSLMAKESATTEENIERFTPESLGGFIKKTGRGPFAFNNKQREGAAWLEASGMRGVLAQDTGVGKTLTSLASIKNAVNEEMESGGVERRFLFVSPKSLVGNLRKEVKFFMSEGGEKFVRDDGEEETTPNWKKIILSRIDEMSYEEFVASFSNAMGVDETLESKSDSAEILALMRDRQRRVKYAGGEVTITYDVLWDNVENKEISRKEVDFKKGRLNPSVARTASDINIPDKESKTVYEVKSYPALSSSEKKTLEKERSKGRRKLRKLRAVVESENFPKVNKKFKTKYYACFFDEINEIFKKGGTKKSLAVASLKHPRKVFLTASAIDRDPIDLYRLSTLAKGEIPTPKSEKAFANKYGNMVGGRMVALKPDPAVRDQFYKWVKENAYFSPKTDINHDPEFGVDYASTGLSNLQLLKSRTITTQMPQEVQNEYRVESKKITRELKAMLYKYRNLKENLSTIDESEHEDLFYLKDEQGNKIKTRNKKDYKKLQDLTKATGSIKDALQKLTHLSAGDFKVPLATNVLKENHKSKILYFCTNLSLARKTVTENSVFKKDRVHALCWDNFINFYQNGEMIARVTDKDGMSVEDFELYLENKKVKLTNLREASEDRSEATWAVDISKEYLKENKSLSTAVCSDSYARGFNFQTFTKVVHLDRGNGFDSELIKQRTARAYRGGQKGQVEEIFIDATFTEGNVTEGTVSDDARFEDAPLENACGLSKNELEQDEEYTLWMWDEDDWIEVETIYSESVNNVLFNEHGVVRPVTLPEETDSDILKNHRRIVLPKGKNPKDAVRVARGLESISIDQLKSLVNEADQDFFQEIIREGLKSDLTERIENRKSDTGVAIRTPASMLRSIINPTQENISAMTRDIEDYEENPLEHIAFDPSRYDDAEDWLLGRLQGENKAFLNQTTKNLLDLIGGPSVIDYHLGDAEVSLDYNFGWDTFKIMVGSKSRFSLDARISVDIKNKKINNHHVILKNCAPRGYSSKFLFSEIVAAKKMGVTTISCDAAGSSGHDSYSGYAVWPKFGFEPKQTIDIHGLIKNKTINRVEQSWLDVLTQVFPTLRCSLLQLLVVTADMVIERYSKRKMESYEKKLKIWIDERFNISFSPDDPNYLTKKEYLAKYPRPEKPKPKITVEENYPIGEKFWAKFGFGKDMELDLKKGSPGMKIANAYLKRKALEKNVSIEDYLNAPTDLFNIEDPWCWADEIDKVQVKGLFLHWKKVVSQYPSAFKSAWYAHKPLREKVEILCQTDREFQSFMKKYRLVDPHTDFTTPSPKSRALQSADKKIDKERNVSYKYENVGQRVKLGSDVDVEQIISDRKLWEESQDPCLQSIWEELRLNNHVGRIVAEIIEGEEDPDLIEAQKSRRND